MLPRKIFENVHAAMTVFMLFEYFSSKFYLNFFDPNFECFANMMHCVRTFSIMRA